MPRHHRAGRASAWCFLIRAASTGRCLPGLLNLVHDVHTLDELSPAMVGPWGACCTQAHMPRGAICARTCHGVPYASAHATRFHTHAHMPWSVICKRTCHEVPYARAKATRCHTHAAGCSKEGRWQSSPAKGRCSCGVPMSTHGSALVWLLNAPEGA